MCTAWRAAADQEALWSRQRQRDFPQADDATLAVLLERAGGGSSGDSSSGGGSRSGSSQACRSGRAQRHSAAKLAYWWLAREWTCERCQQVGADDKCHAHSAIALHAWLHAQAALVAVACADP